MDKINQFFHSLNNNNYFIGCMMILLNIGSKYFMQELNSNSINNFFNMKIVRRMLIFTVFFVATRDVKTSIILTAAFVVIALELFNDQSKMCILPKKLLDAIDTNKDGVISNDEIQHALKILKRAGYIKMPSNTQSNTQS